MINLGIKSTRNIIVIYITVFITAFGCAFQVQSQALLVNSQVGEKNLSPQQIKSTFLGTTSHWQNGLPISLCIDTSDASLFKDFIKKSMGKNIRSFKRLWSKRVFSGASSALPLFINNHERVLNFLAEKQGAVCYIASLPESLPKHVKQLNTE